MDLVRRSFVILAFGLWLGGFTFYTGFVIPIGHRQFPDRQFGFVTKEVTSVLGGLAGMALLAAAVNVAIDWRRLSRGWRRMFVGAGAVLFGGLIAALVIHAKLDALLDDATRRISDPSRFMSLHERYELVATIQWAAGLLHLCCYLAVWRGMDRKAPAGAGDLPKDGEV